MLVLPQNRMYWWQNQWQSFPPDEATLQHTYCKKETEIAEIPKKDKHWKLRLLRLVYIYVCFTVIPCSTANRFYLIAASRRLAETIPIQTIRPCRVCSTYGSICCPSVSLGTWPADELMRALATFRLGPVRGTGASQLWACGRCNCHHQTQFVWTQKGQSWDYPRTSRETRMLTFPKITSALWISATPVASADQVLSTARSSSFWDIAVLDSDCIQYFEYVCVYYMYTYIYIHTHIYIYTKNIHTNLLN